MSNRGKGSLDEFYEAPEEDRQAVPGWVIERRRGVTEATVMTLEEFCAWWKNQPPLFDDAPMWRPLYWDATLEQVYRAHVVGEMTVATLLSDAPTKTVRDWMRLLAVICASNRAVQDKMKDLSEDQKKQLERDMISPEWNPKTAAPKPQLQLPGQPVAPAMPRGSMVVPTRGRFVLRGRRPVGVGRTVRERIESQARKAQS